MASRPQESSLGVEKMALLLVFCWRPTRQPRLQSFAMVLPAYIERSRRSLQVPNGRVVLARPDLS